MGRLVIKRSTGAVRGQGLVVKRGFQNKCLESIENPASMLDLKVGKGTDAHLTLYYTTPTDERKKMVDEEESCTTESKSRSNSIEEDGENSIDSDESMDENEPNVDEEANKAGAKRIYIPLSFLRYQL